MTRSVCIGSRGRVETLVRLNLMDESLRKTEAAVFELGQMFLDPTPEVNLHIREAVALAIPGCVSPGSITIFKAETVYGESVWILYLPHLTLLPACLP